MIYLEIVEACLITLSRGMLLNLQLASFKHTYLYLLLCTVRTKFIRLLDTPEPVFKKRMFESHGPSSKLIYGILSSNYFDGQRQR
jgi:hypothetical protein